jgi:two-component system chemotaxis response regulator CheY
MAKTVLLVDDAAFMRMRAKKVLDEQGYQTFEASDGKDAVSKYQQRKPDLVMMDITMPIMDGITAIGEIMKIDSDAKIIVCSALGQQNMVISAIKAGAKDYVLKPFQPERVLEAVKKLIG